MPHFPHRRSGIGAMPYYAALPQVRFRSQPCPDRLELVVVCWSDIHRRLGQAAHQFRDMCRADLATAPDDRRAHFDPVLGKRGIDFR